MEKEYKKALEDNIAYINEHRENVRKAFDFLVKIGIVNNGSELYYKLKENIYYHDISKYGKVEFEPYAKRFFLPNGKKLYNEDFDKAWLHHIHNNPHHWNYWVLVDGVGEITALEMPEEYVYEMICDWLSFGFKKGDLTEIKSFNEAKRNEYILHPNTRKLVDDIINKIVDEVEKEKSLYERR